MPKSEIANTTQSNSASTDLQKPRHAQEHAQTGYVRVKSVKTAGFADVYNLEVEDTHRFAVNGGLIVHNCVDALRYSLETLRRSTAALICSPIVVTSLRMSAIPKAGERLISPSMRGLA